MTLPSKCLECGSTEDLKIAYSEEEEWVTAYFCPDCYEENVNP